MSSVSDTSAAAGARAPTRRRDTVDSAVEDLVGEPSEFEAAFDDLYRAAYRAAYRILGCRADAEEIAQETCARCLVRWRRVADYAEAWTSRAAANLAIDTYRRQSRRPPDPVADLDVGEQAQRVVELRADLVAALQELSRRQREVVVLRYLMDLPERDVARALGCSEGSVKRHASRGMAALRERLAPTLAPELLAAGQLEGTPPPPGGEPTSDPKGEPDVHRT
jgi:RNA polymerase sigma factor (sigma-70 family)